MPENETSQRIAEMCADCANINVENGKCKLVPPFISNRAQETKMRDGICVEAGVFDANGNILKAINNHHTNVWVLTIQS